MVTRRKYKVRRYRDGGRVLADAPIAEDAAPEAAASPPVAAPPDPYANRLMEAVAAQRHAEALQRRNPIHDEIDRMPISDVKKMLLKQHPELVTDRVKGQAAAFHHQAALSEGVPDDSVEMLQRILSGVQQEVLAAETSLQRAAPAAPPVAPEPAKPAQAMPPAAAPKRRSMPMSAPVSRDIPGGASGRRPDNTLSPEERDIARRSFSDPNLTNAQKEELYWRNREKYRRQKADGSYSDQGSG